MAGTPPGGCAADDRQERKSRWAKVERYRQLRVTVHEARDVGVVDAEEHVGLFVQAFYGLAQAETVVCPEVCGPLSQTPGPVPVFASTGTVRVAQNDGCSQQGS